jgi:cytoskeleton protein RodZ
MPDQVDWRAIEREAAPGRAVGRLLRDQREARGLSLTDVEKSLRIRRGHLEAIEEGRFDKLPGAAYIPAFLRAYAAHVDLDPEKVMTAYHLSGPVPIKRPVALPADFPIVERRAPIGLAVLTILLVVGAGYGVWHYMPRDQAILAEKVPPVPDRLLASRPSAPPVETPVAPVQEPRATSLSPSEAWPVQRLETTAPVTTTSPVAAPLAPPPIVIAVPAPPPPVTMTVPAIGQAQAAQLPAVVEQPRAIAPQATPTVEEARVPAAAPDAAAVAPSIPVRVDTPVSVRVNSWVELRAPNGDVLAQTYVRAGESYTVPAGIAYRLIEAR